MRLDAARRLRTFACGGRTYRYYSVAAAQALGLEGAEMEQATATRSASCAACASTSGPATRAAARAW
jgi:hypothetical protein